MRNYTDLNDYEILYMVRENDEDASELMYKKYMPVVYKTVSGFIEAAKKVGLEKEDLEQIQYETYIRLDMYVEALEYSGKFNKDNGMFLKSGEEYYDNFCKELNNRNENI